MLGLLTALVLGLLIGIAYMIACKKDGYNKNFIIGLVLLPAIVSVVILLIGSNVARAFSMAGAFALVRFRSAFLHHLYIHIYTVYIHICQYVILFCVGFRLF